ncbi:MAG: hypothetical protein FGM15_09275 [Chthoniobacterales bacterium]|nr:hypothetical protein [Chthoniobacterales bacterium]
MNEPARIFTAKASGGVEGRDLPGLAVAFQSAAGHYLDLAARKNGGAGNNDLYAVNSDGGIVWLCYSDGWQEVPLLSGDYVAVTEATAGDFALALLRDGGIDVIAWSDGWKARRAGTNFRAVDFEQPMVDITTHDGRYFAISGSGDLYEISADSSGIPEGIQKVLEGNFLSVAANTSGAAELWLGDTKGGLFIASCQDDAWRAVRAVDSTVIYRNLHTDIHRKDGQLWAVAAGASQHLHPPNP